MTSQTQNEVFFDIEDIMQKTPEGKRVGVVFNDDGEAVIGFVLAPGGKDSKQYRECASDLRAAGIHRQAVTKTKIDTKTLEGAKQFGELLETNEVALAISSVVDYFGMSNKGEPLRCTREQTRLIFEKYPTWREKVSAELEGTNDFLKVLSGNSSISHAANSASQDVERTE